MSHSVHFLQRLDRVPRSLTDFALGLYRDVDRVKWIIHYAHLPNEQERVALALADGGDGPYIVVTREGSFVTALGIGMKPNNLTVLTRSQVDTFSARVDAARARLEIAKEVVTPGKQPVDLVGLLTTRPWGLSREEFSGIAAWVPILGAQFLIEVFDVVVTMVSFRHTYLTTPAKTFRKDRRTRETLASTWNMAHGIGARYALAAMGDLAWLDTFASTWTLDCGPTWFATDERVLAVAVRGVWAAARMGKAFLPTYKRALSKPGPSSRRLDAVLALTAIGLRHASLRDDARRIAATLLDSEDEGNLPWARQVLAWSNRAFDDPEGALDEVAAWGSQMLRAKAQRAAPVAEYQFARNEDVPRELSLLVAVNQTFDSFNPFAFYVLPWVAKLATPEDLYCPEALQKILREPSPPEEQMAEVYERHNSASGPKPFVREEAKPGRNDACACGSGKKFKKCCGR